MPRASTTARHGEAPARLVLQAVCLSHRDGGGIVAGNIRYEAPDPDQRLAAENYTDDYRIGDANRSAFESLNTVAARVGIESGPRAGADRAPVRHDLQTRCQLLDRTGLRGGLASSSWSGLWPLAKGGREISPHFETKIRTNQGKVLYALHRDSEPVIYPRQSRRGHDDAVDAGVGHRAQGGASGLDGRGRPAPARISATPGSSATRQTSSPASSLATTDNSPTKKATGGGLPVEVWTRFMRSAHQGVPVANLPKSQAGGGGLLSNLFPASAGQRAATAIVSAIRAGAGAACSGPLRRVAIASHRRARRRRHRIHRPALRRPRVWMDG